jgi:uncharacterized protein
VAKTPEPKPVTIPVDDERRVSGLLIKPRNARALYALAHGAGAGMNHPFLAAMASLLAERGIATLRYQFPYMEAGGKRPDQPAIAEATVRASLKESRRLAVGLPLFAGGKSFGGRMTSQAEAAEHLPEVKGLIFLGFPLHAPGKASAARGDHLEKIKIRMLFLQGTRDEFADLKLLKPLAKKLGRRATLHLVDDANHGFRVPAKTGRKPDEVMAELAEAAAVWIDKVLAA